MIMKIGIGHDHHANDDHVDHHHEYEEDEDEKADDLYCFASSLHIAYVLDYLFSLVRVCCVPVGPSLLRVVGYCVLHLM